MNDIAAIKAANRIETVIGEVITLRREGTVLKGLCPFHGEKTGSFGVNPAKQRYKCFGCGESGDVIDFVEKYYNLSRPEAMQKLSGALIAGTPTPAPIVPLKEQETATIVSPCPEPGQIVHPKHGAPSMRFDYRDADGRLLFCTCRFDTPDGKVILPWSYWQKSADSDTPGAKFWSWRGYPTPRPIYGLDRLAANPTASVLIVEGEKAADAAQRLLPHIVVVTWCGGTNATQYADWTPLQTRRVMLFPDNDYTHAYGPQNPKQGIMEWQDQPGPRAMLDIATRLKDCPKLFWVMPPENTECGWDLADGEKEGWDTEYTREFIRNNMQPVDEVSGRLFGQLPPGAPGPDDAGQEPEPETPDHDESVQDTIQDTPTEPPTPTPPRKKSHESIPGAGMYFKPLGFEIEEHRKIYWFFNYATQSALKYSSGALVRETTLFELAPMEFWMGCFPAKGGKKIDTSNTAANLMSACDKRGYFTPANMRGRGAWTDRGRIVFNTGKELIYNGARVEISGFDTDHAYTRGDEIHFGEKYLSDADARLIAAMFKNINFERAISRYLLAGWAVLAPFCGALSWRSHVWLNGPAGTGKSWIILEVMRRLVGPAGLAIQGNSTEPGIRQMLKSDARPVMLDEAEAESETGRERIDGILEFARSASSADGGAILKGSAGGKASPAEAKSMFLFGSIVFGAHQESDTSRISVLSMYKAQDGERDARWKALQEDTARLLTPENMAALRNRTLKNLPTIMANIAVFREVLRDFLGDQRAADQIGTLVAGAYSLHRNAVVTAEQALEFVSRHDWSEETRDPESSDELRMYNRLMECTVKLDLGRGSATRTLAEMAIAAAGGDAGDSEELYNYDYNAHLRRCGMFVEDGRLYISNTSNYIRGQLQKTPWGVNWHKVLLRVPGARAEEPRKFAGVSSRCVSVVVEVNRVAPVNTERKDEKGDNFEQSVIPF